MIVRRWATTACVALVVACGTPGRVVGGEATEADPDAFERGLAQVSSLYDQERARPALEALQGLLEEHARQPYVRGRRAEIEDLARRLSFMAAADIPKPEDLVSGELKRWDPRSGKLQIEYTPDTRADLERSEGGVWYLPMDLRGPSTLEIRGTQYPMATKDSPTVYLGGGVNERQNVEQSYMVVFGTPPYTEGSNEVWMPARILRYDGDERVVLCEKEISPAKRGRSYKLKLKIGSTSLQASINGRAIGKAKKRKEQWGYLGFECLGWEKVIFSGEVEPSWIQSKRDAALDAQREAFDASYDVTGVLPAWLLQDAVDSTPAAGAEDEDDLPEPLPRAQWPLLERIYAAWEAEDHETALKLVATLREAEAAESVCAYLEAITLDELGRYVEALACAERCGELAPEFAGGHLERAFLLRRLGRLEDCEKAVREAIRASPKNPLAYESGALAMMLAGRLEEARDFVRLAARAGVVSKRLGLLDRAMVKAEKGPTWARTYEHESANYHVLSDIDKKTCLEASRILEEAFTAFRVHVGWVPRDRSRRFKVYLFGGQAGFLQYQEDLRQVMGQPEQHAAGLYSTLLKQLLIWNLPSRDEMYATIRHEGFHQYLDRFLADPPTWFNEGLAVYYEDAEKEAGRLAFGQVQREYLDRLQNRDLVPLKTFLGWSNRRFYAPENGGYPQAWAFVHMLRHGTGRHKELFRELVAGLESGTPAADVVARVLPDEVLSELDDDLEAYVQTLGR